MNTKKSARPNILILYADQMQHDRMGFVDGVAYTPNLDSLAAEGVHFTHVITQQGQCVPSRAVLMTGQSAHECGVMLNYGFFGHQNMLTSKNNTIAKVLKTAGYDTAYFGKGHLGSPIEDLGWDNGRVYDKHSSNASGGKELNAEDAKRLGCEYVHPSIATDYKATEDAVKFLRSYKPAENPLLFMFSLNFPHPPFFSERRFIDRFRPEELKLPESFYKEDFDGKPAYQKEHAAHPSGAVISEESQKKELADYYSMIAAADDHFGQVIAEFKRLGIWDNTIVLFTSDHGDMMGAHRTRFKGTLPYDELFRVPCIFKLPKGSPCVRETVDDLLSSQSFPGTLIKLAGLEVPASFTGGEFTDAFSRAAHPENEKVFFEHYCAHWGLHPFYGVRTRQMKYVRYYGKDNTEELYDLTRDPCELRNLAFEKSFANAKAELSTIADKWWKNTDGRDVAYYESDHFRANLHNKS